MVNKTPSSGTCFKLQKHPKGGGYIYLSKVLLEALGWSPDQNGDLLEYKIVVIKADDGKLYKGLLIYKKVREGEITIVSEPAGEADTDVASL